MGRKCHYLFPHRVFCDPTDPINVSEMLEKLSPSPGGWDLAAAPQLPLG